jgi:hypothetical protein
MFAPSRHPAMPPIWSSPMTLRLLCFRVPPRRGVDRVGHAFMTLAGPIADRLSPPRAVALPTPNVARTAPLGLRDRLAAVRDRLYESAAFRRWAGRIPIVRVVARSRSRQLFDLVAGSRTRRPSPPASGSSCPGCCATSR